MKHFISRRLAAFYSVFSTVLALTATTEMHAASGGAPVVYTPKVYEVQGQAPLNVWLTPNLDGVGHSVTVTSPSSVVLPTTITVSVTPTQFPAGVSAAQALSYITLSTTTLTMLPLSSQSFEVTLNIPVSGAGDFVYRINTSGWPAGTSTDQGIYINAHAPPPLGGVPPTVTISSPVNLSTYSYQFGGSVTVPISSWGIANAASPITTLTTDVSGPQGTGSAPVAIDNWVLSGLNTQSATGVGSVTLSKPGTYVVNAATTNAFGQAMTSIQFNVVETVPPPTVAITSPSITSYTYENGSTPPTVDFGFVGTSYKGGITLLTATLDGLPLSFTAAGISLGNLLGTGPFTATGTRTALSVPVNGASTNGASITESHRFAVTAVDLYGTAGVSPIVYKDFTVTKTFPAPTLVINSPADGTVYTRTSASTPFTVAYDFDATIKAGNTITSITDSISSPGTLTLTKTGEGTTTAHGSGLLTLPTAGVYTLTATTVGNGYTVTKTIKVELKDPVVLAKPTVKITTLGNTTGTLTPSFTYIAGSGPLSIPYALLGTSQATAGITSLVAKIDGTTLSPTYTGGTAVGKASAPGTGTLTFASPTAGAHTITADIADANGVASDSFTFTINIVTPVPTLTITAPLDGSTYNHVVGQPALQIPFSFKTAVTPSPAVMKTHAATIAFNGGAATAITLTNANLNTANATGGATLSLTTAGTYVITATGTTNYGQVVTGKTTIKVTETQPAPQCTTKVTYTGDLACGTVIDINYCNKTVDFTFLIKTCCTTTTAASSTSTCTTVSSSSCGDRDRRRSDCYSYSNCNRSDGYSDDDDDDDNGSCVSSTSGGTTTTTTCVNVADKGIKLSIYEIYSNGTTSAAQIISYGSCGYTIDYNKNYKVSFAPRDYNTHRYHMDIFSYPAGSTTPVLVGTKEFATK